MDGFSDLQNELEAPREIRVLKFLERATVSSNICSGPSFTIAKEHAHLTSTKGDDPIDCVSISFVLDGTPNFSQKIVRTKTKFYWRVRL